MEMTESIETVNEREKEFFNAEHHATGLFGIESVKNEILKVLRRDFSGLKMEVSNILWREKVKLELQLTLMNGPNFTLKLITDYIENVKTEISESSSSDFGKRIGFIFWKSLPEALDSIDVLNGIDRKNLKVLIRNSQVTGRRNLQVILFISL